MANIIPVIVNHGMIKVASTNSTGTSNNIIGMHAHLLCRHSTRQAIKSLCMGHHFNMHNVHFVTILNIFWDQFTCWKTLGTTAGLSFHRHILALLQI